MPTSKKQSTSKKQPAAPDAIAMLTADHARVKQIFARFEKLKDQEQSGADKQALVQQACNELTVHAELEEEIFYPAVREAIDDQDLMDEAVVEHAGAKDLIAQLEAMDPDEDLYDAKVTVLSEQIAHHVEEEEGEMFPKAKKAKVDTMALGAQMAARKVELLKELGIGDDADDDSEEDDDESAEDSPGPISHKTQVKVDKSKRAKN